MRRRILYLQKEGVLESETVWMHYPLGGGHICRHFFRRFEMGRVCWREAKSRALAPTTCISSCGGAVTIQRLDSNSCPGLFGSRCLLLLHTSFCCKKPNHHNRFELNWLPFSPPFPSLVLLSRFKSTHVPSLAFFQLFFFFFFSKGGFCL